MGPSKVRITHLKVARHRHREVLSGDETVEHGRGIEYLGLEHLICKHNLD